MDIPVFRKLKSLLSVIAVLHVIQCFGQNSFIRIESPINQYLKDYSSNINLRINVSGKLNSGLKYDTSQIEFSRYTDDFTIGPYPPGVYSINVVGYLDIHEKLEAYVGFNFTESFNPVTVKNNDTVRLCKIFPSDCAYLKTFAERVCPLCHSHDHVVPIYYNYWSEDDPKHTDEKYFFLAKKWTECSPMVYCTRDKLKF
jgi:hypothetical protein